MTTLGPAAAILMTFIGAIAAVLAIYGVTGGKARRADGAREFPSLG